ncbi:hypothetical protein Mpsy_0327 [Methanolobus psychrophilus R15]|nr:hypothetical protein Mpsy_0327 [Methanolobus psychrophilus R15]
MTHESEKLFLSALRTTLPVFFGYIPLGIFITLGISHYLYMLMSMLNIRLRINTITSNIKINIRFKGVIL